MNLRAAMRRGSVGCVLLLLPIAVSIAAAGGGPRPTPGAAAAPRVPELLEQLELPASFDNLQRRRDAARRLSEIKPLPETAIAPMANALDTWDRLGVQRYARVALAGAGARTIPALAAQCRGARRNSEGCQASIEILGQIAHSEATAWPVLVDDFETGYGAGAAIAVGRLGAPAVPMLRRALKSNDAKTRAMAARALYVVGPSARDAIPDLDALLNDTTGNDTAMPPQESGEWPSPIVQYEAALALARIDPKRTEALPVLMTLVPNRWTTGDEAIEAIGKMGRGGRSAIPALEAGLESCCNHLAAVQALAEIEGCLAEPVLARVLKNDKDGTVRFHTARALTDLGPACPGTIAALTGALGDDHARAAADLMRLGKPGYAALTAALASPDLDVRKSVVDALSYAALGAPWVGKGEQAMRPLSPELAQALMVAMNDRAISIREQAARALQFAGGGPQRLALAELDRESAIYARESQPDRMPRTREQIAASIPPDADNKYPLTIEYLFPIDEQIAADDPTYLISLHRGRERSDRLVFWKNAGADKYVAVKTMESPEMDLDGRFLPPKVFRAKVLVVGEGRSFTQGRQFVDVPQVGCNTRCVVDNVFAIQGDDFIPVQIESPEQWYKPKLKPDESTWNSNGNSFTDHDLSFAFSIWAGEDAHASPTAGEVTGTYKVIRETMLPGVNFGARMIGGGAAGLLPSAPAAAVHPGVAASDGKPAVIWKMVVDTAQREPRPHR